MRYLVPLVLLLAACASSASGKPAICDNLPAGDYCAYDEGRDAAEDLRTAMAIAADNDQKTIVVMGADWCHDSRALAGHFQSERFLPLIAKHYRLVYVDVGMKNRNLSIARSFGFDGIVGTPTVVVLDSDGAVLNYDTAPSWRNAASRTEDAVYEYFAELAER